MSQKSDTNPILEFRKKRDWKQFHLAKNLAISLVLEATEVLELFQWTKDNNLPKEKQTQLSEELADVYYWLLLIANDNNVDLSKALKNKMKQNEQKYPEEKTKGKSTKYNRL